MTTIKKNIQSVVIIIIAILAFSVFLIDKSGSTQNWLTKKKNTESNLLILEGWMSLSHFPGVVEFYQKGNYSKLLVTEKALSEGIKLGSNSSIIVRFSDNNIKKDIDKIKVKLKGTYANNDYSCCNIMLNDSIVLTKKIDGVRTLKLDLPITSKDSISIVFTNDFYDGNQDRNLSLMGLSINRKEIDLNSNSISVKLKDNYYSAKQYTKSIDAVDELVKLGVPINEIVKIDAKNRKISKTYNYAHKATQWMSENKYKDANIVTLSYHSRRTYLSFKKANSKMDFGIIPIKSISQKKRSIKEVGGIILLKITPKFILDLDIRKEKK